MTLEVQQKTSDYKCYNCQKPCIRGDPSVVRAVGNLYHKQCFKCNFCQISVIEKFYIMDKHNKQKDDVILCEKDYYQSANLKCHQCNQSITQNNYEVIGVYKYHRHCLHCPGCTIMKNLSAVDEEQDESFERYDYNNRPYCRYHYSLIKGTECVGCGQAVLCEYMDSHGKWHQECYMMMKYWHIVLIDLQPILQSDYKSKNQLIIIQDEFQHIRSNIWKELSIFEDMTSKTLSSIVHLNQSSDYKKEYEACLLLFKQVNILFSVLDLVFRYLTHLSCDLSVQKLGDQLINFIDILCQMNATDEQRLLKMATSLSQYTRDLIKLSLQQTIILEQRNIGQENNSLIDAVIRIFQLKEFKSTMDIACLDHYSHLIDMTLTRLSFVLNIREIEEGKRPDETTLYKPQSTLNNYTRPSLFPISHQQKRMINSTSNIHSLTKPSDISNTTPTTLKRSKSTSRKPSILSNYSTTTVPSLPTTVDLPSSIKTTTSTSSRMDTIRRALTTSRSSKKENAMLGRSTSIFSTQANRREQKSFSLHNPSTPPLFISLPDVEQLNTTPPLSPPSANQQIWTIPAHLPDLTLQQDCIIRHIAVLCIESHVTDEESIVLDDLLALLDNNKKTSSSLWGKLKTHILTPTGENNVPNNPFTTNQATTATIPSTTIEKKIGVSLSNTSHGSLNIYKMRDSTNIEYWKTHCPSVVSCFSSHSLAPNFLKDCVLAMIDGDVNTEGIFRKNGNIRGLKEMCDYLDESQQQDWNDFFKDQQIIQLAAFVKRYLRELPEPLLTYKLHKLLMLSNNDIKLIHYAISALPKMNRDILLLILALLNWVARHASDNKMGYENLARVMAPNILYSHKKQSSSASAADVSLCHGEIRVVATMIEYYETMIKVPSDFTQLLEHPKMAEYLCTNTVDLTCSKHFVKSFSSLSKVKKDITLSALPPSPSTSSV